MIVATDEDNPPILELNPFVVVVTDELKLVIVLDNPDVVVAILELILFVVVATEELKEFIVLVNPDVVVATLELNSFVVVATDEDKEPILVDILELKVE